MISWKPQCEAEWFPTLISCSPNLPSVYIRLCKHGNHFTFLQWKTAFFSLTHLLPKFFQTTLKELLLWLYLCFKYQPWQNWKENVKCTCNRHIVFHYQWSQQSLPVNHSDFNHSIWNDFIKLSGCHFTRGKKKNLKKNWS